MFYDAVGKTPLVRLGDRLLAKLETYNPTGSIKDRMVSFLVQRAEEKGEIRMGATLVEATSGNTGISLAAIGAAKGYPVLIILPKNMSDERKIMIRSFGATIIEVGKSDFKGSIELRNSILEQNPDYWSPRQFENSDNVLCHRLITAPEIMSQIPSDRPWSAFITGAGTGGTMMGVKRYLDTRYRKKVRPNCVLVVPAESAETHGIQGINDGADFLLQRELMDEIQEITTEEAIEKAKMLCRTTGYLVGISSGANVLAAERWIEENDPTGYVVTILCDRGERYMSVFNTRDT
jgi:cysteine synthase A